MAQGVVDLLELVEIDEKQRRQLHGIVRHAQKTLDFIAEIEPVGQRRQFVVTRKMADPGFRIAPFGDVFKQHHGAAPGHGESPPWPAYDLEPIADAVHRAVTGAGLSPPVLAGHSAGGVIATIYAARYPAAGVVK